MNFIFGLLCGIAFCLVFIAGFANEIIKDECIERMAKGVDKIDEAYDKAAGKLRRPRKYQEKHTRKK